MPSSQEPMMTLRGIKVSLGPLRQDYLERFWPWFNDLEVMRTYSPKWSPMTWETLEQWYHQAVESPQTVAFTVHENEDLKPIGYSMLLNVKPFDRIADFDIIKWRQNLLGTGVWNRSNSAHTGLRVYDPGITQYYAYDTELQHARPKCL